jgi:hypothetical protein
MPLVRVLEELQVAVREFARLEEIGYWGSVHAQALFDGAHRFPPPGGT